MSSSSAPDVTAITDATAGVGAGAGAGLEAGTAVAATDVKNAGSRRRPNAEYVIAVAKEFMKANWYVYLSAMLTNLIWAPVATIGKSETSTAFTDTVASGSRKQIISKLWIFVGVFFASNSLYVLRNFIYEEMVVRAQGFVSARLYERAMVYFESTPSDESDANVTETIQLMHHCSEVFTHSLAYFLNDMITAVFLLVSFAIYMMRVDGRFGALVTGSIIAMCMMCGVFVALITYRATRVNQAERASLRRIENAVANVESVSASGTSVETQRGFDAAQGAWMREKRKYIGSTVLLFATWTILLTVLMIVVFYSVALSKRLPRSKVQSLIIASLLLTEYLSMFVDNIQLSSNQLAGLFDPLALKIFNRPEEAKADETRIPLPEHVQGRLISNTLTYRYPGGASNTVDNLTFDVPHGSTVLIKGHSGSGKSTLIKLLNGMLPCTSGDLHLGGCSILKYKKMEWRKAVFMVSQKLTLFDGSIADNVLFGTGITGANKDHVEQLVRKLGLHDALPDVGAHVGKSAATGGGFISGGMAKIIVLLRGALRTCNPQVLSDLIPEGNVERQNPIPVKVVIYDEPMAGLDLASRDKVLKLLRQATRGLTSFYVTHLDDFDSVADMVIRMPECTVHARCHRDK